MAMVVMMMLVMVMLLMLVCESTMVGFGNKALKPKSI